MSVRNRLQPLTGLPKVNLMIFLIDWCLARQLYPPYRQL